MPRNIRNRNNKFDKNVTKRGNVPLGKVEEHGDDQYPVSKKLIVFFLIVVVGSSLVQVLNLFNRGSGLPPPPPPAEDADAAAGAGAEP